MKCWMIELVGEGRWWDGNGVDDFDFTSDPFRAIKFVDKKDALNVIDGVLCHMFDLLEATEHIFDE